MKIEIKGMIESSMLDWDGRIVSTLFVSRCNFRCPFCQNQGLVLHPEKHETIPLAKIKEHLQKFRRWIDGICLTGGEPCIYADIGELLKEIRELGMKVKLDTNGALPDTVKDLLKNKMVDYIAMDVKAPIDDVSTCQRVNVSEKKRKKTKYEEAAGGKIDIRRIKESIKTIMESGIEYEFRTTIVPSLHTADDVVSIARSIKGARKYCLQNFVNKQAMKPEFRKIAPYKPDELENMKKLASPFVKACILRGA